MKRISGLFVAAFAALLTSTSASAGEYTGPGFAADLVISDPSLGKGQYKGRYYFDRGGYRIDIRGKAKYRSLIFNSFHGYYITVAANRRMNVEDDSSGALLSQFDDFPCAGFHEAVSVGSDGKSGRELQVWRCKRPKQELLDGGFGWEYRMTVWYDAELKHFVRKEGNDGLSIQLRKIVPGRQSPSLFDMPGDKGPVDASARVADVETVE